MIRKCPKPLIRFPLDRLILFVVNMSMSNHSHDGKPCGGHGTPHQLSEEERLEAAHLAEVIASFTGYSDDCMKELAVFSREILSGVQIDDLELMGLTDRVKWVDSVTEKIQQNQQVLDLAVDCFGDDGAEKIPSASNLSKTRSTLKQMVREWSAEGAQERDKIFKPIIEALVKYLGHSVEPPLILCPGSGLGRLPYEIVKAGFSCQGNEFSYHMIIASSLLLNGGLPANSLTVYPYVLSRSNRETSDDIFRAVAVPDESAIDFLTDERCQLSMVAGEMCEVYEGHKFDGIATCFFLDTAKNCMQYVRLFSSICSAKAVWVNCGPLLWHFAHSNDTVSIELSWEEVRALISKYWDFQEEREIENVNYTAGKGYLSETSYDCIFFVCTRNDVPVDGYSEPVY